MKPNNALRKARKKQNWSQQMLAHELSTTRLTINRWEQGKSFPGPHFRARLCELFGLSELELGLTPEQQNRNDDLFWSLPFARNLFFTGQEELLQRLHHALLQSTQEAASAQVQIISGLAGMGKSQVALEYAYRFRDHYSAIFWLQAETPTTLTADILNHASLLDLPEQPTQTSQQVHMAFTHWMRDNNNWLLILDHVEDLTLVRELLPFDFSGHVIITTRQQITGPFASRIDITEMSDEEGAHLLLRRAKLLDYRQTLAHAEEKQQALALQISGDLTGYPLAIEQAGAFIEETGCSLADYIKYMQHHGIALLKQEQHAQSSVHHTITHILGKIEQRSAIAMNLLRLCAFLDATAIPEELFYQDTSLAERITPDRHDKMWQLDTAIATLRTTSLIYRNTDTRNFQMHRLVQMIIREQLNKEEQLYWLKGILQSLQQLFPTSHYREPTVAALSERLLPHVLAALDHLERLSSEPPGVDYAEICAELLYTAACYLRSQGNHKKAEQLLQRCLTIRIQLVGPEHLEIVAPRLQLGHIMREQKKQQEAEEYYLLCIQICKNIYGTKHPELMQPLYGLAHLYYEQHKYRQAAPLYAQIRALYEQSPRAHHPNMQQLQREYLMLLDDIRKEDETNKRLTDSENNQAAREHPADQSNQKYSSRSPAKRI
ncbi:tetratricopeptide repeat protein [Dictyobacter arantiisoli]|uniref:HTH cro/C1-type domain-containing protein n=1 Tax=Dictyobacter arantiisoli TaxID=2014874 RepID=A0A5A5T5S4_9CHLR|nr:tetratricopeptide repeat protein [Dictyobacter arantiisoli]GCF06780.1 hypothetical protein KDI_03440 [Dictyobacter arantiisoli]